MLFIDSKLDFSVNIVVSTRETISTRSVPSSSMSMYHGRSRYSTWSGHSMSMSTTEGTIAVDVIDAARNQLIWEGAAIGRVTDSTRQNIEQVAHDAIADIFSQFP